MTSLFGTLTTKYCPDCRRLVVVQPDSKTCPAGHELPKPATIHPEEPKYPDVKK